MKKILGLFIAALLMICPLAASAVSVSAESAVLINGESGEILYSKNADERRGPASTTKIMTALVAIENCPIGKMVAVSPEAVGVEGSSVYLKANEKISMESLLYALLLSSANDAAAAIAYEVAGGIPEFAELMNEKAAEIGLTDSNFTNPIGLHEDEHYSTGKDIYTLSKYAFSNDFIKQCLSGSTYTLNATNMRGEKTIVSSNLMINPNTSVYYKYAVCGKTGFTDQAGRCLVSIASNKGYNYIAIVLGTETPGGVRYEFIDSANMFRWAFNNFEYKPSNAAVF